MTQELKLELSVDQAIEILKAIELAEARAIGWRSRLARRRHAVLQDARAKLEAALLDQLPEG